ncbi:MAG: helix-turn-helix domain-containing protein [Candidatus Methanomethylophilaceae archaeon]|nr:helix-turn-helix domain-containing protein [Candidatus Methanomethylophilaceae archaeon]
MPLLMYQKLREADRRRIHTMLSDGMTHAEIAQAMKVCVKTIDREAVRWKARMVTVRTEAADGGRHVVSSVRVGADVKGADLDEILEDASRMVSELEAMSFEISEEEIARATEEAERAAKEAEAMMSDP